MKKITETTSLYNNLEKMNTEDLLLNINYEDQKVAKVVAKSINSISKLADVIIKKMKSGGRLFYIGSGTSGRLGIVDASECPPTFGVSKNLIIGLIAGGDSAIRASIESAEDDMSQAWEDLKKHKISKKDVVVGISASGTTPYVVGGLKTCQEKKIYTGSITCNEKMQISEFSDTCVVLLVGPEFVTGSTRMKAGTAQKMVLNMLSTTVMIKLGHVMDNQMVDMQLNNDKLRKRGVKMLQNMCKIDKEKAVNLLKEYGNVRRAINSLK